MKFERLRLQGFKTFVDQTDLVIAAGLTGIVGPNGCGKSNLVEALRWVMGETSFKSLRGGGMEDVIFAGSATRPERNQAEVTIRLAEPPQDLTGHLAGADQLEITRRIARDSGSTYRINGRECRARDVQILFADAASGARSPSLVRQGQIGEIIAAKPQLRRRIIEDAAGIGGLNARRHEAELRLRAAETNLDRAEDVIGQLDKQIGDLRRQARQAERYRAISAEIRALERALLAAGLAEAAREAAAAEAEFASATRAIADAMVAQGQAERERALAAAALEAARKHAHDASEALQAGLLERQALDTALKQAETRLIQIAARRDELARDAKGAAQRLEDAKAARAKLAQEAEQLAESATELPKAGAAFEEEWQAARARRTQLEAEFSALQGARAEFVARRRAGEARIAELDGRQARLAGQLTEAKAVRDAAPAKDPVLGEIAAHEANLEKIAADIRAAEAASSGFETELRAAREAQEAARPRVAEAERLVQRLETEARTIRALVEPAEPGLFAPVITQMRVAPGLEAALAAALGDDLDAAPGPGASRHWGGGQSEIPAPPLPGGISCLLDEVEAPEKLRRRLTQIGLVAQAEGARRQAELLPGQRLVSREGDLWRWDGFTKKAEAASAAARRLAERNRLSSLDADLIAARESRQAARSRLEAAIRAHQAAQEREAQGREAARRLRQARESANGALQGLLRRSEASRIALESARIRAQALQDDLREAQSQLQAAREALEAEPKRDDVFARMPALEAALSEARQAEAAAIAAKSRAEAERSARMTRLAQIETESRAWTERAQQAEAAAREAETRAQALAAEAEELEGRPAELAARRRALAGDIDEAAATSRAAADALARAESAARATDDAQRGAFQALAAAREAGARLEMRRDHAGEQLARVKALMAAEAPADEKPEPGEAPAMLPPDGLSREAIETRLVERKADRERLGAVNLRAEAELAEIEASRGALAHEREEITEAIRRFRRAIDTLNAEGRKRLRAAFDGVNAHFTALFGRLFGGGNAELQLIEAEDPLEAGLEIIAKPPGKKPQLLTLLSGGEQALTATALIFAVFLTNPSPICVLDEVDAPLDDSNVERLCDLLADMARETATRFLVITHNPITMARMDRLFGVTMVERGVSQLVSVDLVAAEKLAEAG